MKHPAQLRIVQFEYVLGSCLTLLLVAGLALGGCVEEDDPIDSNAPVEGIAASVKPDKTAESNDEESGNDDCPTPRACPDQNDIEWNRSLIIRDAELLKGFSFKRVMDQIVETSGDPDMTSLELYQRWWDTMNAANIPQPPAPFEEGKIARFDTPCDSEIVDGQAFFNDFPVECPRIEGILAYTDPFSEMIEVDGKEVVNPDHYVPIGLFNRLDLAPSDGSHCGEYRIVFAKKSGQLEGSQDLLPPGGDRNLLIFEAVMPNPNPQCGVDACLPIAQYWKKLSKIKNMNALRNQLEQFYFEGFDEFDSAIHADHLGPKGGHIRTNQFMPAIAVQRVGFRGFTSWQLRDFKLTKECAGGGCDLGIKQLPVGDNPFGNLFSSESDMPQAPGFKDQFIEQVPSLAIPNLKTIFFKDLDEKYLSAESNAPVACLPPGTPGAPPGSDIPEDACYDDHFDADSAFADRIQAKLDEIGSPLTPTQIVQRADTLSCAGCHQNVKDVRLGPGPNEFQSPKPPPIDFVHISEENPIDGRFHQMSPMMFRQDIPHRAKVFTEFMCKGKFIHDEERKEFERMLRDRGQFDADLVEGRFETLGGPKKTH